MVVRVVIEALAVPEAVDEGEQLPATSRSTQGQWRSQVGFRSLLRVYTSWGVRAAGANEHGACSTHVEPNEAKDTADECS